MLEPNWPMVKWREGRADGPMDLAVQKVESEAPKKDCPRCSTRYLRRLALLSHSLWGFIIPAKLVLCDPPHPHSSTREMGTNVYSYQKGDGEEWTHRQTKGTIPI